MWRTIREKKQIWKGIVRNLNKSGKSYYVDTLVMPILDTEGRIVEYISLRHDVTEVMNPTRQLRKAITDHKDPLLITLRLEAYESYEEFYSHHTVGRIEDQAARHLCKSFARKYDFEKLYTLGNGEFALILDRPKALCNGVESFVTEIEELQRQLREETIEVDGEIFNLSLLMSISYAEERILESARLGLKKADRENQSFILARNLAHEKQEKAKKNLERVHQIRKALEQGRIRAYFQPIIDNCSQKIVRYESLVRLIDEQGNPLPPRDFLEASKKSDLYRKITETMLRQAFEALKSVNLPINVNLSPRDIESKRTRTLLYSLLETNDAVADRLVIELLEDEDTRDYALLQEFIRRIKSYGSKIAIDDFGSGYSNYERLGDYRPDILKIDGSLVRKIGESPYAISIVKSIVTFARENRIATVAEFVENEEIYRHVKELGIDYSQGYHFGRPLPLPQRRDTGYRSNVQSLTL